DLRHGCLFHAQIGKDLGRLVQQAALLFLEIRCPCPSHGVPHQIKYSPWGGRRKKAGGAMAPGDMAASRPGRAGAAMRHHVLGRLSSTRWALPSDRAMALGSRTSIRVETPTTLLM